AGRGPRAAPSAHAPRRSPPGPSAAGAPTSPSSARQLLGQPEARQRDAAPLVALFRQRAQPLVVVPAPDVERFLAAQEREDDRRGARQVAQDGEEGGELQ